MNAPFEVLDPALYAAVRRPLLEAETMPPWCYTSAVFYQREVERIFLRAWNFIGREDRIPRPGDYFALDFAGVPVVIVRGKDGAVRALINSCRHRGAKVMTGAGNCSALRCPYHSWTYALDGVLKGASDMDQTVGFKMADYALKPVKLETWAGFMFINFDPDSISLASFLGDLPERMAPYNFADMVCVRRAEYDLDCNWKIYVENAMEAYHVPTVHMKTLQKQTRDINPPIETGGGYCGLYTRHEWSRALLTGQTGFPYIPSLTGDTAEGTFYILMYPSTMFGCTYDCMWWLELHPIGPGRSKLTVGSCFPSATVARDDFDEIVTRYYHRWETSIMEDNVISDQQQLGLASPFASPGRLSILEPLVHTFDNWVLDRVLGDGA